jgi:hypothetical protein
MYQDFIAGPSAQDSVNLQEQHSEVSFQFGGLVPDADPGVEMESTMAPDTLAANLGFSDGLPMLFNRHRHRGGLSSWDPSNTHLFEHANAQNDPDMIAIALHYHQLAGIHALLRMLFHPLPAPGRCRGTLTADDVGLGKTYLAGGMIAVLTDVVLRQSVNATLPPIFREFSRP